ncbi:MAG: hypothetical protein WEA04_00685 [Candidatus Andersenbacteria bacterium]
MPERIERLLIRVSTITVVGVIILLLVYSSSLSKTSYLRTAARFDDERFKEAPATLQPQPISTTESEIRYVTRTLRQPINNLMAWPGILGTTQGVYWAVISDLHGSKAPFGPRLFITEYNNQSYALELPAPPYPSTWQTIMESFSIEQAVSLASPPS